jgi:hypothetical protein
MWLRHDVHNGAALSRMPNGKLYYISQQAQVSQFEYCEVWLSRSLFLWFKYDSQFHKSQKVRINIQSGFRIEAERLINKIVISWRNSHSIQRMKQQRFGCIWTTIHSEADYITSKVVPKSIDRPGNFLRRFECISIVFETTLMSVPLKPIHSKHNIIWFILLYPLTKLFEWLLVFELMNLFDAHLSWILSQSPSKSTIGSLILRRFRIIPISQSTVWNATTAIRKNSQEFVDTVVSLTILHFVEQNTR